MAKKKQTKIELDPELKQAVQVKCVKQNTTMVKVITDYLQEWVK